MSGVANKALVQRLIDEVLTQHNLAVLDEIVHPDFVELDPAPGQEQGREGLKQFFAAYFDAFPDVRWTLEEQVAEGALVVSRATWQGTQRGPFLGIPPTGKAIRVAAWTIDRIEDGLLVESRNPYGLGEHAAATRCTAELRSQRTPNLPGRRASQRRARLDGAGALASAASSVTNRMTAAHIRGMFTWFRERAYHR